MRTMNMFGRKMPVVAILMALLVIGTASAAVFTNYATLNGDIDIDADIYVIDSNSYGVPIGGTGDLDFASGLGFGDQATFTIVNDGEASIDVDLVSTVMEVIVVDDVEDLVPITGEEAYFSVEFSDGTTVLVTDDGIVTIPVNDLVLYVNLVTAPNVEGTYNVEVEINPV